MIKHIAIHNYKSIQKLELDLGRINVFIGENGCGKSNILEAIALGSAAVNGKLDNEFLFSRGIRVSRDPAFMRAAFDPRNTTREIRLSFKADNKAGYGCNLNNSNEPYGNWRQTKATYSNRLEDIQLLIQRSFSRTKASKATQETDVTPELLRRMLIGDTILKELEHFLIYSPENSYLRMFEREGQIQPLGIKGEGLFRFLKYLSKSEHAHRMADIKKRLRLIEWFRDLEIAEDAMETDLRIDIKDKYVSEELGMFDQASANEGFLMILFYLCVVVGAETPRFFAIDNIDASLNPRLCTRLMVELSQLTRDYGKQVILTTHNPAILDGLNLDDPEQRLYVARRSKSGHTLVTSIRKPQPTDGQETVKMSEAFLRGYIGGLPGSF
jgi:predicted ATPase